MYLDKAKVEASDEGVRLEPGDDGSCLPVGDIKKTDLDGDGAVGREYRSGRILIRSVRMGGRSTG